MPEQRDAPAEGAEGRGLRPQRPGPLGEARGRSPGKGHVCPQPVSPTRKPSVRVRPGLTGVSRLAYGR